MPNLPQPLTPLNKPGIVRFESKGYGTAGLSPQTRGIQLPEYGSYDLRFLAWIGNPNSNVHVFAKVVWYKYDPSGASAFLLAKTDLIGAPELSKTVTTGSNVLTGMTVSNPSETGLITVGVSWSDGTSKTPAIMVQGFQWATTPDFTF